MFRFRWIRQLFAGSNCVPPSCLRKIVKPSVKPRLETLEDRTLPSANPIAQFMASAPIGAINHRANSLSDANNSVSPLSSGEILALVQTIESEVRSDLSAFYSRAQALADMLMSDLQGLGLDSLAAGQSLSGSGSGSGSGAMTTAQNTPNQQLKTTTPQAGSGAGSGAAMTAHDSTSTQAVKTATLLAGSGSGNLYTWDPPDPRNNDLASNPVNWLLNGQRQNANGTVPGNKPTDWAIFDPQFPGLTDGNGNADIIWDRNFTQSTNSAFSTMKLGGNAAYTGQQTINPNVTVELTGVDGSTSLIAGNTSSNLYLYFGNGGASFQIDANATITNMKLAGFPNGYFEINGGTTTIAQSPGYTETIGVGIVIGSGATLNDQSNNSLQFTNDNLDIHVDGTMLVFYGNGPNNTLIANGGNLHDYIDVDYGTLKYEGASGVTDTIAVPILVEYIGTFSVIAAGNQTASGKLIVQGGVQQTNSASVYLNGQSASVQLASGATLECDKDYYQASGTLESMDTTKCTLQDGNLGTGTATINGGSLVIAQNNPAYGEFDVKCGTLNFNAELHVAIAGYQNPGANPGSSDLLQLVNGNINLGGTLYVRVDGQVVKNDFWVIIGARNIGGNFANEISNPQTTLDYLPNQPINGQYEIKYSGG